MDQQTGSSTSAFVSSLIFNLIIFSIFIAIFIFFRNKYINVYKPRTINRVIPDHLKTPPLSSSPFGWLPDLLSKPKKFIIQHAGIDGYFFLRYLLTWAYFGMFSGLILWPVLFAINATGGGGQSGFNIISYANNTHKWRVFANLFCSWFFFGFVVYTIYSELVFYIGFRHNLQCTPFYSSLRSSKVLLVDNVDQEILFEDSLRRLFPTVQRIAITRDTKKAREIWEKRNKLIGKLEGAFIKVINKCLKSRSKMEKKLEKGKEIDLPVPIDEIESYIPEKKLPSYKYRPIIGKSKKVFNEGIEELHKFNDDLEEEQAKITASSDELPKVGSVFLEFESHLELQRAYQAIESSENFKKSRKFQSFFPEDVIWNNVGVGYAARKSKQTGANLSLTLLILFWAIPVAVVGCISNINYLTEKVHFLRFINNMPAVLMGIITGILPSILLSILMSLVPPIIKYCGKKGGCLTAQQLDYWSQQWYFAFQVIQVFLVTTCASAATSVVTSIINDPSNALTMLAANLPPASNFYICYMLLQGLSISSGMLAQVVGLILSFVIGRIFDKTPRQKWNRQVQLSTPSWGILYANFGLFTVILMCYAIIAPIIIAFTSIAFMLIFVAQLYTFIYVSGHTTDNRGRNYPLALFEIFVGVYLGEICLIGLFVMQKNWACVVLESVWLGLTVLAHLYFRYLFDSVLDTVPIGAIEGFYPNNDMGRKQIKEVGVDYFVTESGTETQTLKDSKAGNGSKKDAESSSESLNAALDSHKTDSLNATLDKKTTNLTKVEDNNDTNNNNDNDNKNNIEDIEKQQKLNDHEYTGLASNFQEYVGSGGSKASVKHMILRYFKPKNYVQYSNYRSYMPDYWIMPISKSLNDTVVYQPPEITDVDKPVLWIAKDRLGISKSLISKCDRENVICSEDDAEFNEKNKVILSEDPYPPGYQATIMY
jgi:hypothetical protein